MTPVNHTPETWQPQAAPLATKAARAFGLIMPPLLLASGALMLLLFQLYAQPKTVDTRQETVVETAKPAMAEPVSVPALAPARPEPKPPAVSPETLAAKRTELTKTAAFIRPAKVRQAATTQRVFETVSKLLESNRQVNLDKISAQSAETGVTAVSRTKASLSSQKDSLEKALGELASAPRPPRQALSGFSPVAKPAKGEEYHFEVIGNHVAFIDLEKLMELVKKDFQVRVRLSGSPRGIRSEVGPVGDFGLAYEIGPAIDPASGMTGFGMKGWEVIPASESRGETLAQASEPLSNFQRVIKRLSPGHATITMWVYPSGFDTFRKLRDLLHTQGYMVAARPLPEGVPVRGSPSGSLSAGQ
ncbi:MAG: hypothetical protein ACKO5E_07770 [bacterium]